MPKFLSLLLLYSLCSFTANANFNFNARCTEAYKDIFKLRLNDARLIIKEEKQHDPQNGINILLDNYVDYFDILMSENKADYEKLKDLRSDRIIELQANDKNSPYFLYSQAEVYLQWGILKAKFGDYFSSFLDIKKARGIIKDNIAKYPDFLPNQKDNALIDAILGRLPSNLKGISKFLGMSGNTPTGIAQLERLHSELGNTKFSMYTDEIAFFLCYIEINLFHTNNYNQLITYVKQMDDNNALKDYLGGYVSAKNGHNDEAIRYLEAVQTGKQRLVLPAASYLLGNAKLCRMDSDANIYLLRYINEYKGTNYIKDTYLKLAYFYLLDNDTPKYNYYLNLARTKGPVIDEKDKQALREANDAPVNIDLLKARLYYDGGYYPKALAQLNNKQQSDFKLQRDQIEFPYRLGRIFEKTGKFNEALACYQKAINLGKSTPYYFAANAALGCANIYELKKDNDKAAYYYRVTLDMKNHEYQNSTEYDAKQGLERIHH
jgi:hypothetical protein